MNYYSGGGGLLSGHFLGGFEQFVFSEKRNFQKKVLSEREALFLGKS
jgi:hypothetical protein